MIREKAQLHALRSSEYPPADDTKSIQLREVVSTWAEIGEDTRNSGHRHVLETLLNDLVYETEFKNPRAGVEA
jgi:hypothetical protein